MNETDSRGRRLTSYVEAEVASGEVAARRGAQRLNQSPILTGSPIMTGKSFSIGIFAGLILGAVSVVGLSGVITGPRAMAQAQLQPQAPPAAPQRYQIAAWAHPAGSVGTNGGGTNAMHGAYILDTQTGKVWEVNGGGQLRPLGGVE
jgi:hypothetical protein